MNKSPLMWINLLLLLLVPLMAGCDPSKDGSSMEDESPIVAAILATSGPADFIGSPEEKVLRAMEKEYQEKGVGLYGLDLQYRNSQGKPERALTLFETFAADNDVLAIIGPSTSGESLAVADLAEEYQIPLLSLAASKKIVEDEAGRTRRWCFKFAQNDDLAAEKLIGSMVREGESQVGLLYSTDGFGKSGAEVFRAAIEDSPLILAHESGFPSALNSPEPFIAALPAELDAVMIWGTAPGPALLLKTLRRNRKDLQVYLSHGNASEEFLHSVGSAAEGAIIIGSHVLKKSRYLDSGSPLDAAVLRYRAFWHDHFVGEPSHFGGHARDALEALLDTLSPSLIEQDTAKVRREIRDRLENLRQFHGVTGTFNFSSEDHAGLTSAAFEVYRVESGEFTPL